MIRVCLEKSRIAETYHVDVQGEGVFQRCIYPTEQEAVDAYLGLREAYSDAGFLVYGLDLAYREDEEEVEQ